MSNWSIEAMILTPRLRKLVLTAHVAFSVGLLGSIAGFLALAITALAGQDAQIIGAMYLAMETTARLVIVPLAFASILSGLIQSLGTAWGLFRHYWVLAKFVLTVFATIVLLTKLELIEHAARLATGPILPRANLDAVGIELAVHAAGGLLVLLVPTVLSIYKPWGPTPYGRRKTQQRQELAPPYRAHVPRQSHPVPEVERVRSGEAINITLRRAHICGLIAIVVILHLVVLHNTGIGFDGH